MGAGSSRSRCRSASAVAGGGQGGHFLVRARRVSTLAIAVAAATAAHAAWAAESTAGEAPTGPLEEIVVTAQRREQTLQDVPLSVQAFSGDTLALAGVDSTLELPRLVPNLNIARASQTANVRLSIRGVGAAGNSAIDPSIGTFVDDVYVPRPGALFGAFNDMASVEVLRGPQGTLFGRNSTVGGILFRTSTPVDAYGASAELRLGNYGQKKAAGMINLPAADRLAFRLSGLYDSHDGYAWNRFDRSAYVESASKAARFGVKWAITDSLTWTVKADWSEIQGDGMLEAEILPDTLTPRSRAILTALTGGNPPDFTDPFDHVSNQLTGGELNDKQRGLVSDLSWKVAGDYTLRLLSGYRKWQNHQYEEDVLFTTGSFLARTGKFESTSQSHEFQVISPQQALFDGRLDFVAGLYWFQEDFFIGEILGLGADFCDLVPAAQRPLCAASGSKSTATDLAFDQDAENYAAYAQGNVRLADSIAIVIGARWTEDDKSGSFVQQRNNPFAAPLRAPENVKLRKDDHQLTYRIGLNWTPNDDVLVFGSYSTGYKSGGFNSGGSAVALGQKRLFDQETAENYELGVKSMFWGGRARANATIFHMTLDDFQDRAFDGTSFTTLNAGSLTNNGAELEGDVAVTDDFTVHASLGYLDAEFSSYPDASCLPYPAQLNPGCTQNLKGERPVFAPQWQGSLGVQLSGNLTYGGVGYLLRADVSYMDDINVGVINDNNPQSLQGAYTLASASAALLFGPGQRLQLVLSGENLTDEGYCVGNTAQPLDSALGLRDPATGGTVMRCGVGVPRTYGLAIKMAF